MSAVVADGLASVHRLIADGTSAMPISKTLGFAVVDAEEGRVVLEGEPGRDAYDVLEAVHGGYVATLLDSACGIAVQSALSVELTFTTLELKVSYLHALDDRSGVVQATGSVIKLGRRVCFAEAQLHDGAGRLCASATSTLLVMSRQQTVVRS